MSEQNRALALRWFDEVWNQGSEATIDELFHPQGHSYGFPESGSDLIGPGSFKPVCHQFKSAFSGIHVSVEDIVALRWTSQMTHSGDGLGFPATGALVALGGSSFVHFQDGKIMKAWNHMDFTQLA